MSESQFANRDHTNLAEAEALLNVMRARQTLSQVAGQISVDSSAPNGAGTQDSYDNLYRGMVRAYARAYTAKELQEIKEFFESPAGQAFLDKKPLLTEKYLEVVQNILTEIRMR
jgi:hypothetical protein